jgi:hypothetical protein
MKRAALFLACFLPWALPAQDNHSTATTNQREVATVAQANISSGRDDGSSAELGTEADVASTPDTNLPQQPNAKPSPSGAPRGETTPKIPGSMVGYIDDPIVGSQIRIRFDDAFDDAFPDRSEFFYAKCGCYRGLQNAPPPANLAFDPKAPGPGPGIPRAVNYQQLYMNGEYAPIRRFSVFVEVPIRFLQPQGTPRAFSNQSGIGDVQAGFKLAAVATDHTYLTFQFRTYFPSGDAGRGLGTNHYSVEPSILLYHSLTSRFVLEGQVGDWHPIGGSSGVPVGNSEGFAGDVFMYGLGPSYKLYSGSHFGLVPVVELFGWHVVSGFQTQIGGVNAPDSGTAVGGVSAEVGGMNIVNLKVGLRTNFGFHNSVYVGFGQALTHDDWYKHIVRVEYRYTF